MNGSIVDNDSVVDRMRVVIVGCGLGGLACAISCRREGVDVLVLEKARELSEVGAGIQLPPNATRVMADFGLLDELYRAGAVPQEGNRILRWSDGRPIGMRPGVAWNTAKFDYPQLLVHRADYQRVLLHAARRLGAEIRLGCEVAGVECNDEEPVVTLVTGERITADVIVGADGLKSQVRTSVLGYVKDPEESGDLAYRITIPRGQLEDEDPVIRGIFDRNVNVMWWGENMHVVLYSIRGGEMANLVLISADHGQRCPDNLPEKVAQQPGDLAEMQELFRGWDPRLHRLIAKVQGALKWKIWSMEELDVWIKGSVALLGDSCHPGVPYAASGAAMAVEDGAVLGRLFGLFEQKHCPKSELAQLVQLYQQVRKQRATATVKMADQNRIMYHMPDGEEQQERDRVFADHDWWDENRKFPFVYGDLAYLRNLNGFDTVKSADDAFAASSLNRRW